MGARQRRILAGGEALPPARIRLCLAPIAVAATLISCVASLPSPSPTLSPAPQVRPSSSPAASSPTSPAQAILSEIDAFEQQAAATTPRAAWLLLTTDIIRLDGPAAGRQSRNLAGTGARDYAQGRIDRWRYFDEDGNPERELRIVRNLAGQIVTAGLRDQTTTEADTGSQLDVFAGGLETGLRVQIATGLQAGGIVERRVLQTNSLSRLQYTLTVRSAVIRDPQSGLVQRGAVTEFDVDPQTGQVVRVAQSVILESDDVVHQTQALITREVFAELPDPIEAILAWSRELANQGAPAAPALAIHPAGAWIAAARQERLFIYDTLTGNVLRTVSMADFKGRIRSLAVTSDGRWLALGLRAPEGGAFGVALVDAASWTIGSTFRLESASDVLALAWSADDEWLYGPAEFTGVIRWTVRDGSAALLAPPAEEQGPVNVLAVSRDGARLAGLAQTGISLWALDAEIDAAPRLMIGAPAWGSPIAATWAPTGGLWAVYAGAWLVPWNTDPIGPAPPIDLGWGASTLALSPNGAWLATDGDRLRVWEAGALALKWESDPLPIDIVALAWTPDNLTLVTRDVLGAIDLWDAETGTRRGTLAGP